MSTLTVVLGDQLSFSLSSLQRIDRKKDQVLMMEVINEATYVPHHPKKIAFLFSAMRHFAKELKKNGYQVHYIPLTSKDSKKSFTDTLKRFCQEHSFQNIVVTEPGEFRVLEEMLGWESLLGLNVHILEDTRFFCSITDFKAWAKGKKSLTMEMFYRQMRKKTGFLMTSEDSPTGEEWNFDKENRKPFKQRLSSEGPKRFAPDTITKEVLTLVEDRFDEHFGSLKNFWFAVTTEQAKQALEHFITNSLPHFGAYQDQMIEGEPFLFHSLLSQYLNCGLLTPKEVCIAAEHAYLEKKAPINSVEGFIRQVLGWREFIRGIYWLHMPNYKSLNALHANRPLPSFYWDGNTTMNCMKQVINQTKVEAQSHHIQRLMITGNFALLAGLAPQEVCDWYLAVYADAYEWVELPNTLGMALFADGGIVGTKPYAASANYINKMSNFCKGCTYDPKKRNGENACPFNTLYWDFHLRHEKTLKGNHRLGFVYKHLERMSDSEKQEIQKAAKVFLRKV